MKIYRSITELVGNTPMLAIENYCEKAGIPACLLAKLEYLNPAGSAKDRVACGMIEAAEKAGTLKEGSVIIEPTSGNTGIGLAAIAARRGYRVILTMPETMSRERRLLLRAYGAELVLTPGKDGMTGAIRKAEELAKTIENSFLAGQFENPENPMSHYRTTGPEIYRDTEGRIDFFVAGVGTGGTLSGVGKYLKERDPAIRIVAVEPSSSAVLSGKPAGAHGLQGIGAGFIPENMNITIMDEIISVTEEEAYAAARLLAKTEGILVGITSGAALHAAGVLAKRPENKGKRIVVLLPDTGDRYLSTPLYDEA